jgi:ABC-2 type transport system ATP-binding protein
VLKRQVAGDVVTLGLDSLNGALLQAQALLGKQSFVREIQVDQDQLRLYVERGEQALPLILRVLDGAGLGLQTISLARPSLDDVFLRQTGRSLREEAA